MKMSAGLLTVFKQWGTVFLEMSVYLTMSSSAHLNTLVLTTFSFSFLKRYSDFRGMTSDCTKSDKVSLMDACHCFGFVFLQEIRGIWRDYIFHLIWVRLGIAQEEQGNSAGERDVWTTLFSLLPLQKMEGVKYA